MRKEGRKENDEQEGLRQLNANNAKILFSCTVTEILEGPLLQKHSSYKTSPSQDFCDSKMIW